jgi:kinesin family protein 5
MQLDEVREQYKIIARSANSRAQQRKLEFLEHNLEALNSVQKQVRTGFARSCSTAVVGLRLRHNADWAQLVEQNTALKKEMSRAETRLMARAERIQNLEAALGNADVKLQQRNQKYEREIALFRERLAEGM